MPIGPPSHRPAPKSALTRAAVPMLATYAALDGRVGRWLTSACQTLFAGRFGQPCRPGPAGGAAFAGVAPGLGLPLGLCAGPVAEPATVGGSAKWARAAVGCVEGCATTRYPMTRSATAAATRAQRYR